MIFFFVVTFVGNHPHTASRVDAFAPSPHWCHLQRFATTKRVIVTTAASDDNADWFQQKRGESDMNFIKRLTSQAPPPPPPVGNKAATTPAPTKGYQRIEDWEAEQEASRKNGTMTWEQRVQFDGLRNGNQIRQNDILMRQINSGL